MRAECLADALSRGERHGVWGGLNERERRRLLRSHAAGVEVADDKQAGTPTADSKGEVAA